MKQLFTFMVALFALATVQAQTPIPVTNGDFEDLTPMALNTSGKWAILGFFLMDVPGTPPGNYLNVANSGLAPGQGQGGTQAFKVTPVQPDATSNSNYQIISLTTDPIDISNREFGKYIYKIYIKTSEILAKQRPFSYTCIATDANGADVTVFTTIIDVTTQQSLNATSVFNTTAATADYQPLHGVFDVAANTNTDPLLGSVLNAKHIKFQLNFGKNMAASLSTSYFYDNFTLTGPLLLTKIDDHAPGFDLNVYPNPARENLTVSCTNGIDEIAVLSMTGAVKNKISVGSNAYNLNISQLPKGSYIIAIKNSKGVVKKIITKM